MSEHFAFETEGERITATMYPPSDPLGLTLLLGPGTEGVQREPFVVEWANDLAGRGVLIVTYDFPFGALGHRKPDANDVLERCCRDALVAAAQCRPHNKLFVGGKSLSARVASHVVADGGDEVAGLFGVVALGYPLHPVGRPDERHVAHLARLQLPMLFVQGTRDPFGTPEELMPLAASMPSGSEVVSVDGGDHSFVVPAHGSPAHAMRARVANAVVRWMVQQAEGGRALQPSTRVAAHMGEQLRDLRRRMP